jgi:threonine/homoserine/homoserine lactone efflux protein
MTGDWNFLMWLLILSIPPGLALAAYWARGLRRDRRPKVPPGEPGNPT